MRKKVNLVISNYEDKRLEDALNNVKNVFTNMKEQRDAAKAQVEEWNKDSEIKKLKEEISERNKLIKNGFCFDEEQWKSIREWEKKHIEKHKSNDNKISKISYYPSFEYSFSYTNVGVLSSVICSECEPHRPRC